VKRAAIYARVSTKDQSTELQIKELRVMAQLRGWEVTAVYNDEGRTGTNTKRPAFQEMLKAARSREFDILLVWKLDRFARSLNDLIINLRDFQEIGIEFVSLKDNLDLTTSTGRLMTQIIGAFAEFEASIIKERVNAGLRNAKAKGIKLGRRSTVDAQEVLFLRSKGMTPPAIAQRLKVSRSSVYAVLKGIE
jgi:DNA invertase Pin-like site-specific DNA recombinase